MQNVRSVNRAADVHTPGIQEFVQQKGAEMPTSTDQVCRYRDESGSIAEFPIVGTEDVATCRRWQGQVVPNGAQPQRISFLALSQQLEGATWQEPIDESTLQTSDFGTVLLSFPLCEVHRRFPDAPLVRSLDRLDSAFFEQLSGLMKDNVDLRNRIRRFVLRMSSTAAAAIAAGGTDPAHEVPLADDLFEFGHRLAEDIRAALAGNDISDAIEEAVGSAQPLRGVRMSEALSVLADSPSTAS